MNSRPAHDKVIADIAEYAADYEIADSGTYRSARYCLLDALGCAVEALKFPECAKLLGPNVPGIVFPQGARVPGTKFELDPVSAAFSTGTMIRWLDFNDVFRAAEGGHPSDNLGGILAAADYISRKQVAEGKPALTMRAVLSALVKAYEIQGGLSLANVFALLGYDHVTLARVAAAAVATQLLGGSRKQIENAVSNAWVDGATLKIYRDGSNTGPRKSWAGGDATSRGVWLALMALKGEMGYPSALTAKTYGFYDAFYHGKSFEFPQRYGTYVVENVIFKFVPAANPAQTAVECAFKLYPMVRDRIDDIAAITITTQAVLKRHMDKEGPLTNPADRDHCARYVVAVGLIHGTLNATDFEDSFAADPRIDRLRSITTIVEDARYTREHLDPGKRSEANAVQVRFKDGSTTPKVEVEYAVGHPRNRAAALPMLESKFKYLMGRCFPPSQQADIVELCLNQARLEATPVNEFMDRLVL